VLAADLGDLLLGLGRCHTADRGLQLVLTRLIGRGRLSEALGGGDELVEADRLFRRVDLAGGLEDQVGRLGPRHRALVAAYCRGVSDGLRAVRPWELRLLAPRQ